MSDIVTLNGYKIKDEKAVRSYDTIALMKADTKLKEGYHVRTKGYYEVNDGGHGEYVIVDDDTLVDDGGLIHVLTNGLRATLVVKDYVTPEIFGAYGDGTHDDSTALIKAFTSGKKLVLLNKNYILTSQISNANVLSIEGNGGAILWKSHLVWNDKNYTDKWNYVVKDSIKFTNINNLSINNLIFKSDKNDEDILTWNGLVLDNCTNTQITNSEISGFNWCGLSLSNCVYTNVNNSKFYENRYGIYNNSTNTIIDSNEISNHFSESEEYDTNGEWISNSTFDSRYYDGIMEYGSNSVITNNIIFDNGQSGIYSNGCNDVIISNNNIYNNWNIGIDLGATSTATEIIRANVTGNNLMNNKIHQINLTGVKNSLVSSNKIIVNELNNTSFGIILTRADTNYNNISYNKIEMSGSETNRGISLDNLTENNNFIFNDIISPIIHNTTYQATNKFIEYSLELSEPVSRVYKQTGISVASGGSNTVDLSSLNLKTDAVYLINLRGTNSIWNASCLLYTTGSGGGSTAFHVINSSNLTVSLSGNTLTINNTNATYTATLTLTISGNI